MKETYSKKYYCKNCNERSDIYYDKGVVAEENPKCPNCGVSNYQIDQDRLMH